MPAYGPPTDPSIPTSPPHDSWEMPPQFTPPEQSLAQQARQHQPEPVYIPQFSTAQPAQQSAPQHWTPQPAQQRDVEAVAAAVNAKMKRLGDFEALQAELAHAIGEADLAQRRVVRLARLIAAFDEESPQPAQQRAQSQPIAGQYVEPQYAEPQEATQTQHRQPQPAPAPQAYPQEESQISVSALPGLHANVTSSLLKFGVRSVADVRAAIHRMATTKEKIPGIGPAYAKAMDAAIKRWDKERQR